MSIDPNEVEIIGRWININGMMTEDGASLRIRLLLQTELQHVATSKDGWEKLYQDPRDSRYWELTFPHGAMQGGGPLVLSLVSSETAQDKYVGATH
jgi:hypothetical protein